MASPVAAFAVASAFFCFAFVVRVSPSVMTAELMRDLDVAAAALGQLSAMYFYAYAAMQLPVGVLMDRYGPRRLLTMAAALGTAGTLVFALGDGIGPASAGRLIVGFGCAFSWVGCITVAAQWFGPGRFARLAGLGQLAGVAGAVLGQAPVALLVAGIGWRAATAAIAAAGAGLAVAIWVLVRDRPLPAPAGGRPTLLVGLATVTANPQTWIAAAYGFALSAPLQSFAGLWAVPFLAATKGASRDAAALTATLMFVGYALGAPLMGWIADRLGRRPPMIAGSLAAALLMAAVAWWPALPLPAVQAAMLALGVASAAMFLGFVCGREHNPPHVTGAAVGLVNTAVMASGALFQPLIGSLLDMGWTGSTAGGVRLYTAEAYRPALALLPLACLAAAVLAWRMREPPCSGPS